MAITWKGIIMDINILKLYRIFAVIGLAIIVYEIILVCKIFIRKEIKNVTMCTMAFFWPGVIWILDTSVFMLGDFLGKPDGLDGLNPSIYPENMDGYIVFLVCLFLHIGSTVLLYLFCGKYAEFHLVYNPKKRRKPLTFNMEESYFVYYGFLKRKRVIWLRDIIVEESRYIAEVEYSKAFPIASAMASTDRLILKLTNGKTYKITIREAFVAGSGDGFLTIAKVMNIPLLYVTKKGRTKVEQWIQNKPSSIE